MMTALLLVLCLSPVWAIAQDSEQGDTKTTTAKADKAGAQEEPARKPAAQTPTVQAVTCTVKKVNRRVRWRPTGDAEWRDMKVGDKLLLGADVCTGLRATCRLEFNENSSEVAVQPVTLMRIGEYEKVGEKIHTRLYLKQGTVQADVERVRFQSDFAIISPEVTLAVQGTDGIEMKRHLDTGSHCKLMKTGLLRVTNNKSGRGQNVHPGDKIGPGMNPAIKNVLKARLVAVYDLHGGNTPAEKFSIGKRPQTFGGTGNQWAPGGSNSVGGHSRSTSTNKHATGRFFRNNPTRLPNAPLKPPVVVLTTTTTPIIDDHGGSGM